MHHISQKIKSSHPILLLKHKNNDLKFNISSIGRYKPERKDSEDMLKSETKCINCKDSIDDFMSTESKYIKFKYSCYSCYRNHYKHDEDLYKHDKDKRIKKEKKRRFRSTAARK